jgi:hypothetical protein
VVSFADTGGNQASITAGTGFSTGIVVGGSAGTGASALEYKSAANGSQNGTYTVGTAAHNYTCEIAAFIPGAVSFHPNRMPLGV